MAKQQTLSKRIQPVLSGRLSVFDLDPHTRRAIDIYIYFKCSALVDLPPEQIKAEIEKLPDSVRGLVRNEARRLYADRFLAG